MIVHKLKQKKKKRSDNTKEEWEQLRYREKYPLAESSHDFLNNKEIEFFLVGKETSSSSSSGNGDSSQLETVKEEDEEGEEE